MADVNSIAMALVHILTLMWANVVPSGCDTPFKKLMVACGSAVIGVTVMQVASTLL